MTVLNVFILKHTVEIGKIFSTHHVLSPSHCKPWLRSREMFLNFTSSQHTVSGAAFNLRKYLFSERAVDMKINKLRFTAKNPGKRDQSKFLIYSKASTPK